jgi:hypothetical protein
VAISAEAAVTDAARTAAPPGALEPAVMCDLSSERITSRKPPRNLTISRELCLDLRPLSMELAYRLESCAV